jgi:hypothetical protein
MGITSFTLFGVGWPKIEPQGSDLLLTVYGSGEFVNGHW